MTTESATVLSRDAYLRGVADGRRTVEAELAAERHAIAALVNSLGAAVNQLTLHLNPDDLAEMDVDLFDICVEPDRHLTAGAVRLIGAVR